MSHADFFLPSIQNILLVSNTFTSDVICSVVVILWHNVAEITYKYIAKLYEMYFLFLMILEYFLWFNRKPAFWIPTCPFIKYQLLGGILMVLILKNASIHPWWCWLLLLLLLPPTLLLLFNCTDHCMFSCVFPMPLRNA